ncbi:MAG: hypothetical protein AAF608_03575 [Pseudomonadota bacterium]
MRLLYMNQGGKGHHGAIKYRDYDIICLAESDRNPDPSFFDSLYVSTDSIPALSIWIQRGLGRVATAARDLDDVKGSTRPIVSFQIKSPLSGKNIHVVFGHLKSGNATKADIEMSSVFPKLTEITGIGHDILLIGDLNRVHPEMLTAYGLKLVECGGGQSHWNLDYVFASDGIADIVGSSIAAKAAADHGHIGISVTLDA